MRASRLVARMARSYKVVQPQHEEINGQLWFFG